MEGIDKRCQRCEADFKCKANDIANCQCQPISISEETAAFLQKTAYGCLCAKCLSELDGLVEMADKTAFPKDTIDFIRDLHYYQEGRKIVFTEFYHIQRGYCCGSKCRHCPYGKS